MAGKKSRNEIESIRNDLNKLTEAVWALRDQVQSELAASAASRTGGAGTPERMPLPARDPDDDALGEAGTASAFGNYEIPDDTSSVRWLLDTQPVAGIVENTPETAASTLAAVGHPQRLAILSTILQKPSSAGELVETLSLGTTGAAYHHLNVLQAAGFVTQQQRGIFRFQPERIPVFVTLLAALGDRLQVEILDNGSAG